VGRTRVRHLRCLCIGFFSGGGFEYWSRRISLSDRGLKWALAMLGLTYLDCYRSETYDFNIDTFIKSKSVLKVIVKNFMSTGPEGNMIWTRRQNLCASKKGWRCLLTTVHFDIDRRICIESSPWLSRTRNDSLSLATI